MAWILLVVVGLGLVAWLFLRSPRPKRERVPALWRELSRLTHDPRVSERLVEAERRRSPELSEAAVLRRVIRRLGHDRHR